MRRSAIAALWFGGLGGCSLYFGGGAGDDQPPPGDDVPYVPDAAPYVSDAAPYVPDAAGPHSYTWWAARQGVTPDAACDPWTPNNLSGSTPALANGVLRLQTAPGESITYSQAGDALNPIAGTWAYLEAGVQVLSGHASIRFSYNGLTDGLTIGPDGSAVTDAGTTLPSPGPGLHYHQLRVELWTGEVQLLLDGSQVATEHALAADPNATPSVVWGELDGEQGDSDWSAFAHDIHADSLCPLP